MRKFNNCRKFLAAIIYTSLAFTISINAQTTTKYLCGTTEAGVDVTLGKLTTTILTNGDVHVVLESMKSFNDNTYAKDPDPTYVINWPDDKHEFKNLEGSDKAEFSFTDKNGNEVFSFQLDYFSKDANMYPSGYGSLGLGGKDGKLITGNAAWLVDYTTSLTRNFNEFGYVLTEHSPATDEFYTPNPSYPNWIFDMVYEVTVSSTAFGAAGFGDVTIVDMHNSPHKYDWGNSYTPVYCEEPPTCDGEIGDFVWYDFSVAGSEFNCNGIQDPGEPGIAGVLVYLKDSEGSIIASTTTDATGYYHFDVIDFCTVLDCNECDGKISELTLRYDGTIPDAQIKVVQKKDNVVVFDDIVQPGGTFTFVGTDAGTLSTEITIYINNVENTKIHTSCSQPIYVGLVSGDFTITDGYSLDGGLLCDEFGNAGIFSACFTVEVDENTLPPNYFPTISFAGPDNTTDSNGSPADVCLDEVNNVDLTIDFGYCSADCENTIGDFIWHDSNVNGIQDDGPGSGIAGVEVELYKLGSVIASTTSDASGYYEFTGLANGTYEVKVASSNFFGAGVLASTGPNMMWNASPKNKTNDAEDSDADKDEKVTVVLDCEDDPTIDFGFFKSCITVIKTGPTETATKDDIITFHFEIENCGDADFGTGVDLNDPFLAWVTNFTLAQGQVKTFDKTYTVTQEDCDRGFIENLVIVVGHPKDAYNTYYPDVIDDDLAVVLVDCGECTSMIGDFVWHDQNVNGIQDEGEPGIEDVVVELYRADTLFMSTITNASGYYEFDLLENGTDYEVLIADENFETGGVLASTGPNMMWNASPKDKGGNDAKDSDALKGEKVAVSLDCEVNNTIDFGFFKSCINVTKTGPTEAAEPGDVITFHIVVENCGDATLGGGVSLVDELLNWSTNFTLASGEIKTFDKPYTVTEADCDSGKVTNNVVVVGHPKDIYNVYYPDVTDEDTWIVDVDCGQCENYLGDFVWHDSNVNGIQDDGEPGIEGVEVQLLSGTTVVATTTTDASGYYEFTGFANGNYTVKITSDNFESTGVLFKWYASPKDATDDDIDSDGDITTHSVDVSFECEENPDVDFGFFKTCVSLIKSGPEWVSVGDTITYHFILENCGDIVLHGGAQVYDEVINPDGSHVIWDDIIDAGEVIEFDRTYVTTDDDCGELVNSAYVIGHPYMPGRTFANVTDDDEWTVDVICDEPCVEDWIGILGDSETLCQYESGEITVTGSVQLTPNPSRAKVQTTWRIVHPNRPDIDNTTHYASFWVNGDTTFTITGFWPGITCEDEIVDVHFGLNVLDCDGNPIHNGVGKDIYWYPWVCPPPPCEDVDIEIEKTSSTLYPEDGDQLTFTITATNNGPDDATGVVVTDILPEGFDYVSDTPSQGDYDETTGDWTVGSLANGASATLTITVTVDIEDVNNATFDLGPAADYNLFVLYDLNQPSSDTQGKVAVGRDATLANYSIGDLLPAASGDALIVGRDLVYTSGHVFGNIVYGNSADLNEPAITYTGTVRQDNPINFASAKSYLENLSTQLGGYTATGTTEYKWSGVFLTGTDPFLNVFDVSGAELTASTWAEINVPNGSVVLVNVDGTNINWSGGLTVTGTDIGNVLYNFYEAEDLAINGIDVRGSILAPFADVNFSAGVQNGQMICKSLIGAGQFNLTLFVGNIPSQEDITNIAMLTAVLENDSNPDNNSSSVTVHVNGEATTGDGSSAGDDGSYWQQVGTFMEGEIVYTMVNDNAGNILAGTWGGKIYRSSDGENWTRINNDMFTGFIWTIAVNSSGHIFAGTEQGIYRSLDNGTTFVLTGLVAKDVRSIVTDSNGHLYAGVWGEGIFKSTDNGSTWTTVNTGLPAFSVNSLVVNSKDELFAAVFGFGIYKSIDYGANWYTLTVGYNYVWTMGVTSTDLLFAGTYGDGLYRSGDDGNQWQKVSNGMNAYYVYAITVDADNYVYVSSWASGVFVSTDPISSSFQSIGLGGIGVSSIMMNPVSSTLFAGTSDGKIYKKVSSVTGVDDEIFELPTEFELEQNYPNPFNPSTTIKFSIPETGKYTMKIYNILGQEVSILFNREFKPGAHNISFSAAGLASGIYFYRLTGDNVNITKKMVLMK